MVRASARLDSAAVGGTVGPDRPRSFTPRRGAPAGFFTDASGPYALPAVTILGHRVVVTARPTGWEWFFGDGMSVRTASPGKRGTV